MYSEQDRRELLQRIDGARDGLLASLYEMSEVQSNFKPAADRWSVAGIVEHLASVEDRVLNRISQIAAASPGTVENARFEDSDAALFGKVIDRSARFQAPDPVQPSGKSLADSLERLTVTRRKIA